MASLYSPMIGIYEFMSRIERDAEYVLGEARNGDLKELRPNFARLGQASKTLEGLVPTFQQADAVYLPSDLGVSLAAAVRDVELMARIISTAAEVYNKATRDQSFDRVAVVLDQLRFVPSQTKAVVKRMKGFLNACEKELGKLEPGELVVGD